jgi:hypothetical protein
LEHWPGGGGLNLVVSLIEADFVFERKESVGTINGQAVSDCSALQHGTFILCRNVGDLRRITSQKSEDFDYTAAEA